VTVTARGGALFEADDFEANYFEANYFEATGSVVFKRIDPFTVSHRSVSVPPL